MMDVPHYWTADQVQLLLAVLAEKNRHQARTAAWRTFRSGGPCGLLDGHGCPSVAELSFAVRRPYRVIVGPAFLSLPVLFEFLFPLGDYVSLRCKISAVM